jgi:hypothetical protein
MSKLIIRSARDMLEAEAKILEQKKLAESKSFVLVDSSYKAPKTETKTSKSHKKLMYNVANAFATLAVLIGGSSIVFLSPAIRIVASTLDTTTITNLVGSELPWGDKGATSTISLVTKATNSSANELCEDFEVVKPVASINKIGFGVPNQSAAGNGNIYKMTFNKPVLDFSFNITSTPQSKTKTPSQVLEGLKLNLTTDEGEIYNISNTELSDQVNVDKNGNTFLNLSATNESLAFSFVAKKGILIKSLTLETFDQAYKTVDEKTQSCGLAGTNGIIFEGLEANLPIAKAEPKVEPKTETKVITPEVLTPEAKKVEEIVEEKGVTIIKTEDKEGTSLIKLLPSPPVDETVAPVANTVKESALGGTFRGDFKIEKTGTWNDENKDKLAQVGETIKYTFKVINTGTTSVNAITLEDDKCLPVVNDFIQKLTLAQVVSDPYCIYTITAQDITNGFVKNFVVGTSRDEAIGNIERSAENLINFPIKEIPPVVPPVIPPRPKGDFKVEKTAIWTDENKDGYPQVGETIRYNFAVSNTGPILIYSITLEDNSCSPVVNEYMPKLEIGQTIKDGYCIYKITADDITNGFADNEVTGTSRDEYVGNLERKAYVKIPFNKKPEPIKQEPIVIYPVLQKVTVRTGGNLAMSYMLFTTGLIGLLLLRINKKSFED